MLASLQALVSLPVHLPMSTVQPLGLADVLCEAPALLSMLPSQDWAALSGCSKQLQHVIHSSVTANTVRPISDAEATRKVAGWPQLALINA